MHTFTDFKRFCEIILLVVRRDFAILRNMLPTSFAKSWNLTWCQECLLSGDVSRFCEICYQHLSQNPEISPDIRNACYQARFRDFAKYVPTYFAKSWNDAWYQECLLSGEISGFCEICHQHISQNPEMPPGIRNVCYQAVFHDFAKYVGDILRKIVVRQ